MNTLHRAIFRELVISFALALMAFNFVLITEHVLRFMRNLSAVGSSLKDMAMILIYMQPMITSITIPMALLISVLLVYSRLNADSEITIMRSSGMSFVQMCRPVFTLGILCFALSASMTVWLSPAGGKRLQAMVADVIARRAPEAVTEGIFNTTFKGIVVYVENRTESGNLEGLFIYDEREKERPSVMYAKEGTLTSVNGLNINLDLSDGHLYLLGNGRSTDLSFGRYRLTVPIDIKVPSIQWNELTPLELLERADHKKPRSRRQLIIEFHRRFSLPIVCMLLMFLGPPLALMAGRTGKLGGLALGLGVFASYYGLLTYAENLVISGKVHHVLGAWVPAVLLGAFSFWMFRKAGRA
jgi:lipopolysaccharide export system permease protein